LVEDLANAEEEQMLAEIFMIWLEALRRQQMTLPVSSSTFVPFNRAHFGSFKDARPRH
jgi:hypothetical protein